VRHATSTEGGGLTSVTRRLQANQRACQTGHQYNKRSINNGKSM